MIKKFLFFILVFISFPCYSWDINPEFHIGNDSRYIKSIKIQSETVLNGKRILFIGSSVTRGLHQCPYPLQICCRKNTI